VNYIPASTCRDLKPEKGNPRTYGSPINRISSFRPHVATLAGRCDQSENPVGRGNSFRLPHAVLQFVRYVRNSGLLVVLRRKALATSKGFRNFLSIDVRCYFSVSCSALFSYRNVRCKSNLGGRPVRRAQCIFMKQFITACMYALYWE